MPLLISVAAVLDLTYFRKASKSVLTSFSVPSVERIIVSLEPPKGRSGISLQKMPPATVFL
jgi:hypothetical protein